VEVVNETGSIGDLFQEILDFLKHSNVTFLEYHSEMTDLGIAFVLGDDLVIES